MNLRNRLIWIAALTVAFAGVQMVAIKRKADQEHVEYLKSKLMPFANECIRQAHERSPTLHGVLTLQVDLVPDGKLRAIVERLELQASSEVQEPKLVECIREQAQSLSLPQPLPSAVQLELALAIEPQPSQER